MPTLIADANPIDKGSMKKRPAKLIAIVCAANAVAPKKEIINAAPLNKLNTTKISKLIPKFRRPRLNSRRDRVQHSSALKIF